MDNKIDYKAVLKVDSSLVDSGPKLGTPDGDRLEVLGTLLEAYEAQHCPIEPPQISEIPDELFEYDDADYGAGMTRNLDTLLPKIGPFWSINRYKRLDLLTWGTGPEIPALGRLAKHRRMECQFRKDFGYVLASCELMDALADFLRGSRVLEAGSGSGYLSKELTRLGIGTFAVDRVDYTRPNNGYPIDAVHQLDHCGDAVPFVASGNFDVVILTWPPYKQPFALDVATAMLPGQILLYCGENAGGNAADHAFFDYLANREKWERLTGLIERLDSAHVNFSTNQDHWLVAKKRRI